MMMHLGRGQFRAQVHGWQDYKEESTKHSYTQNIQAVRLLVSEKIFIKFSYCNSMGAYDPRGVVNLEPRGMIDMIY